MRNTLKKVLVLVVLLATLLISTTSVFADPNDPPMPGKFSTPITVQE